MCKACPIYFRHCMQLSRTNILYLLPLQVLWSALYVNTVRFALLWLTIIFMFPTLEV